MKKFSWIAILMVLVLALGCMAQAEVIAPRGMGQIGYSSAVLCKELTVYEEADESSNEVITLNGGDFIIVMSQEDGWAYITDSDSEDSNYGYVKTDYVLIDPAWYAVSEETPVYAWNDAEATQIGVLEADTWAPVLKEDGDWLIVGIGGGVGFVQK